MKTNWIAIHETLSFGRLSLAERLKSRLTIKIDPKISLNQENVRKSKTSKTSNTTQNTKYQRRKRMLITAFIVSFSTCDAELEIS